MKISKLSIQNFRSLQLLDISLPQVCAIVGPNNSGKSNILEAMRRVLAPDWGPRAQHFSENDVYLRNPDHDIEIACSFDPPIEYRKLKEGQSVDIHQFRFTYNRYKIGQQAGTRKLEQLCLDQHGEKITVQSSYPKKGVPPKYEPIIGIPQDIRETIPLIHIGTNRALRDQLPSARYSLLRRIFEGINAGLHDPNQTVKVRDRVGNESEVKRVDRFRQLIALAMDLLKTDEFKSLEASIKRNVLEQLGLDAAADDIDLFFTPMDTMDFYKSLDLVVKEGGFAISATDVGEGFQNAIVLAVLRAFEETRRAGAILLIEEPEMFLHPQMQRSLYKSLQAIGKTNQVIYTTHSPHFVSIPDFQNVCLVKRGGQGTYVIQSDLPVDAKRKEKFLKELDPERSELFFAKRLLLVEGDTEKLSFPAFANKLGHDLDRAGATIVEVGGKRNLKDFAELAISFKIPTAIVYDKDSSEFKDSDYNTALDGFAKSDDTVKVWQLQNKYEDVIRQSVGEDTYQALCGRYPNVTNATKQRLIALDSETDPPKQFEEILKWLAA